MGTARWECSLGPGPPSSSGSGADPRGRGSTDVLGYGEEAVSSLRKCFPPFSCHTGDEGYCEKRWRDGMCAVSVPLFIRINQFRQKGVFGSDVRGQQLSGANIPFLVLPGTRLHYRSREAGGGLHRQFQQKTSQEKTQTGPV